MRARLLLALAASTTIPAVLAGQTRTSDNGAVAKAVSSLGQRRRA